MLVLGVQVSFLPSEITLARSLSLTYSVTVRLVELATRKLSFEWEQRARALARFVNKTQICSDS